MKGRIGMTAGVAVLVLVAACSHNPGPTATAPQRATPELAAQNAARQERTHLDSLASHSRADSMAQAEVVPNRAAQVRSEVMRETVAPQKDVTNVGLSASETETMADAIHFDYDKSDLTPADVQQLESKLQALEAHGKVVVRIAGNCDERGSDEYNLALGERRAAAAKRWLEAHGVAADRIAVTSYGKERPLDTEHTEEAWAKNRRDDFVTTRTN